MRFSQRIGKAPVKRELEKEGMSKELRNGLWSVFYEHYLKPLMELSDSRRNYDDEKKFYREFYVKLLKEPVDAIPRLRMHYFPSPIAKDDLREWFFKVDWLLIYDFIEFSANHYSHIIPIYNQVLQDEFSAYRFVNNILTPITSEVEVLELEEVFKNLDPTSSARAHLRRAMQLFSDRVSPDYPNSIKESISSIESVVRSLLGDEKSTLGTGLRKLEKEKGLPPTLKKAFSALYGYTSDSGGIRHAITDGDTPPARPEARFMLVTCSAFVNYLITKLS